MESSSVPAHGRSWRWAVGALVLLALLVGGSPVPAAAQQTECPTGGEVDAVELARQWLAAGEQAETVVLARDDDFADALASSTAIYRLDAPLLLTPGEGLDGRTSCDIRRMGAQRVLVLGGTAAISDVVVDELADMGLTVERIAGATRIETAVAIARAVYPERYQFITIARAHGDPEDPTRAFADSLAAGTLRSTLLLTEHDRLSPATADYLTEPGPPFITVLVVGGQAAIGAAVMEDLAALGIPALRVAGVNRFDTAAAVSWAYTHSRGAVGDVVIDGTHPLAWAEGFGAVRRLSAINGTGLFLTDGDRVPVETLASLAGDAGLTPDARLRCGLLVGPAACRTADVAYTMGLSGSLEPAPLVLGAGDCRSV